MASETIRARFYDRLSSAAKWKLYAAVFFIFAPIGLLLVNRVAAVRPWHSTSVYLAFSGLQAAGWAYAFFARRYRVLFLVIAVQALWVVLPRVLPVTSGPAFSISFEGIGSALAIAAGYVLFVMFIAGEGTKTVRLETEMSLAREIHEALIPPIELVTERLELYGLSEPSSEMGGDLIDVTARGDRMTLYIADVSGHGVRAGVVMGMVKSAIRMKLRSCDQLNDLLDDLNRVLAELVAPGMFVTGAFLRFAEPGEVHFAGAGHGPVLQYHASTGRVTGIDSDNLPLGISPTEKYQSRPVNVAPGDVLLLMTDGLVEVFGERGEPLGQAAIEETFAAHARGSLREAHSAVMDRVRRFGSQIDDQTLLLVRFR